MSTRLWVRGCICLARPNTDLGATADCYVTDENGPSIQDSDSPGQFTSTFIAWTHRGALSVNTSTLEAPRLGFRR